MKRTLFLAFVVFSLSSNLIAKQNSYLVKVKAGSMASFAQWATLKMDNAQVEPLFGDWVEVTFSDEAVTQSTLGFTNLMSHHSGVEKIQPNYKLDVFKNARLQDPMIRKQIMNDLENSKRLTKLKTALFPTLAPWGDPAIPTPTQSQTGPDPDLGKQWGMASVKAIDAWKLQSGTRNLVVAVIDTGVDYTHPDLLPNMWRNQAEIPDNSIDDDNNGFVDDIVGWDFASNDNKPYDVYSTDAWEIMNGANPGHGTHCAGNVGATGNNAIGISGVSQNVSIMAIRFITDQGGTTADAIRSIKYAVDNGAKVLSNSWGSEGEDPSEATENQALRDVIRYAMSKDVLFVAAAGNGHNGRGYDNDTDARPAFPASYDIENIVSVAAINVRDALGSFSNWGKKSVHIAAPGVDIYSTVPGGRYTNVVLETFSQVITWDGTSMAAPHVSGAAALVWAQNPTWSWKQVKEKLLQSVTPIPTLAEKIASGGKLNVLDAVR